MIKQYKKIEKPATKPNLLIALASILYDLIKTNNTNDIDSILSLLNSKVHIITQRNPIKKIFSYYYDRKEEWTVYVSRPHNNGPIFIERSETYSVNSGNSILTILLIIFMIILILIGTIGNQFETSITSDGLYNRVYAISKGELINNLTIFIY
jgi:hypothetical protein